MRGSGRPGGEAPGTAARHGGKEARGAGTEAEGRTRRRRGSSEGAGKEARGKDTGEKGKRHWVTGKKVPGCMIRAPARNDKGGRPY